MDEYINLTLENIEKEHICCAIGDPKHQVGVDNKKECGVRIDIWTHFMRECIINYVH